MVWEAGSGHEKSYVTGWDHGWRPECSCSCVTWMDLGVMVVKVSWHKVWGGCVCVSVCVCLCSRLENEELVRNDGNTFSHFPKGHWYWSHYLAPVLEAHNFIFPLFFFFFSSAFWRPRSTAGRLQSSSTPWSSSHTTTPSPRSPLVAASRPRSTAMADTRSGPLLSASTASVTLPMATVMLSTTMICLPTRWVVVEVKVVCVWKMRFAWLFHWPCLFLCFPRRCAARWRCWWSAWSSSRSAATTRRRARRRWRLASRGRRRRACWWSRQRTRSASPPETSPDTLRTPATATRTSPGGGNTCPRSECR